MEKQEGENRQPTVRFKLTKPSMMKNNPSAAAAQVKDSGSTDHDPMQLWHVPSASDEYAAAAEVAVSSNETGKVLRTKVTLKHPLNQQTFTAILDTGTTKSLVATEVVSWYKPQGPPPSYRNVNNELQTARGTITLPFILSEFSDKRECSQQFIIVDQLLHPVILGTDFMQEQGIVIDYKNGTISWDGVKLSMETRSEPQRRVVVAIQGAEDRTMRILDVTGKEIDLSKLIPKENLTSDQKARLWDVLQTFRVVFLGGPGKMKLKPYELPIKPGSTPKAQRPYPVPLIYREATLREVEILVKLGVLEADKDSPWAAPAFVIQKKDGSIRFLTDFRGLNQCLQRHYYPLPRIQDLMRELPKPAFVTALDLVMGYYSRELAKTSRPFTAVVLPWGKYRYCRLPMGISTAPDEFHAVMQQLLGDLPFVRIYLDDVLVLSNSFDEHLQHLKIVLTRLHEAGVVVHPEKSKFCMTEVEYLGYSISSSGKEPIHRKIDAIVSIDAPRNIRELRRFIGMVNYYKDMWRGRSEILAPLTVLTSNKRPFQWTAIEQRAFNQVKEMVATKVMLAYPDFNRPFQIFTDASALQLGGVLMQDGKPLAFWSKKCNPAQQKYTTNKKELLSILEMLREFRSILWGREIQVYTDHKNSLQATFNNAQMLRWRLDIEEFGVSMHYVKGKENVVADALSRLPMRTAASAASETAKEADKSHLFSLSLVEIAKAQQLAGLNEGPAAQWRAIGCTKVLVSRANGTIILPGSLVGKVLQTYHQWLVHPGEKIMLNSIRSALTWPGMTVDIANWVRNCVECARSKATKNKYGKLPTKRTEIRPWAEIAVDSIGPFGPQHWRAMTIIDTSTRLLEIAPMTDCTSAEAARIVDQCWLNRYPRPERCICDQGTEFRGEFQELLESYGVQRVSTTVRNPQANGVIERVHRSINEKLRVESMDTLGDWENCLSAVMFALRAQHHTMTTHAPGQAAFGRDMLFDLPKKVDWRLQQGRQDEQVQQANKRENEGRIDYDYNPDDLVMIAKRDQRAHKLQPLFDGPFRVICVRNNGTLVVDKMKYQETVSLRRVKPFRPTNMGENVVSE